MNLYTLREKVTHDWGFTRFCIGRGMYGAFRFAIQANMADRAFRLGSMLLGSNLWAASDEAVIRAFRDGMDTWVRSCLDSFLSSSRVDQRFDAEPERLIGTRLLVCKSWTPRERGLVVLDYNFAFPVFVRRFDLDRIAERYRLYAEPSWTGLVCEEVMCLTRYPDVVYCAAFEPRDFKTLSSIGSNLEPIANLGAGGFIDDQFFCPDPSVPVNYDLITIARWGRYKRYGAFFKCLRELRKVEPSLRVACVGYPGDLTSGDVRRLAKRIGVEDAIDFFEEISAEEVRDLLRASKVNVLWSKREGTGRTPFEGLLSGVPLILRRGFNYGHHYDYISDGIGHFADEGDFVDVASQLLNEGHAGDPRQWMLDNLSAKVSTRRLQEVVQRSATAAGEPWTTDLAVRLSLLDSQKYQNEDIRAHFEADHQYLRQCLLH